MAYSASPSTAQEKLSPGLPQEMEDICASAGSSSHQHGDSQSSCRSSRRIAGKSSCRSSRRIAGKSSCRSSRRIVGRSSSLSSRLIFAGSYPRWTGARLRSSRSLPGRLSEIMAPLKWPRPVMDYFVNECSKMVEDGKSPANEGVFFNVLERSMSRQSFDITLSKEDLIEQFRRVRTLWNKFHEFLHNNEMAMLQEQRDPDASGLRTGDIYANKFNFIRRHETKLNTIYGKFYESKAKSLGRYRFNIEHSDRYSGDSSVSSKKRSLDEPFSRQLRLKSSDMPESSQNGSASDIQDYDKAMGELINKVDEGTYIIAGQCLRDPKNLRSYSHIPTIERKIRFLHGTWRVMHEPKCVLENLQPADQLFVGTSPNS